MSPATRIDPFLSENFLVEIEGIRASWFSEVSGPSLAGNSSEVAIVSVEICLDGLESLPPALRAWNRCTA
jgi:hypothetical protein